MIFLFVFSRVLTLWFDYGHWPDVNEALVEGVKAIQIDTWLQVRWAQVSLLLCLLLGSCGDQ